MPGRYLTTCSQCTYVREIGVPPRSYALRDGTTLPMCDGFCWCHSCANVTPCEALPAIRDVDRLLSRARTEANERLIDELERTRAWISERVSPPRCLDCGGISIRQFPLGWSLYTDEESDEDFLDIPHPDCTGMLRVTMAGWSLFRGVSARYSPEGERLDDT